ncbi:Plant protein of unknown function [Forsythia ovata]|uniref:Uncharacterized protein n=1 Tax=Forsythia ovata TaxID=205694 RepID=A0ABD1PL31_9LAMI
MTQIHGHIQGMKTVGTKDEWLISIQNYVDGTTKKSQIERVPSMLREIESNKKCYDPLVVSIGPYHHGKPDLKALEMLKIPFAQQFHRACGDQVLIEELYAEVAKVVDSTRECYEEGSSEDYDDESFIRMMFLDACFVLHFMFILTQIESNNSTEPNEVDSILDIKTYQLAFVWRDLFLLENQIPLLVLKVLMKLRFKNERQETKLIQHFLNLATIMPPPGTSCTNKVKKFVDECCFIRDQTKKKQELKLDGSPHLLDLMRAQLIGPSTDKDKNLSTSDQWQSYRSVTELESAGINFKASKTHCVTDVKFKSHLIFEMCPHGPSGMLITSYIWLMDSLIDNSNDVKELRKKGIIFNNLGSDEQLAQLFNEIANDLVPDNYAYADTKGKIEKHCKNK